jgi:hypothetical protein
MTTKTRPTEIACQGQEIDASVLKLRRQPNYLGTLGQHAPGDGRTQGSRLKRHHRRVMTSRLCTGRNHAHSKILFVVCTDENKSHWHAPLLVCDGNTWQARQRP